MTSLYEDHARELLGQGQNWHIAKWETLDYQKLGFNHPNGRMKITGCLAPLLPDGKVDWDHAERGTMKSVKFTNAEHEAWRLQWEEKTGNCSQCSIKFPGLEWTGWDHLKGDSYQTCSRCKGKGTKP